MKIKLLFLTTVICTSIFAGEYQNNIGKIHSRMIINRGEEQLRTNVMSGDLGFSGMSNSNQFIDYTGFADGDNGKDTDYTKTKTFMLGTSSNLIQNPDWFAGITLGHLKSDFKINNSTVNIRSYGFEYFIGKRNNNILKTLKFGYTENKNHSTGYKYRSKIYHIGGEIGHINVKDDYSVYTYMRGDWNKHRVKKHYEVPSFNRYIFSVGPGINIIKRLSEKFIISGGLEYNFDIMTEKYMLNDDSSKKLPRHYGYALGEIGYFIDPDFLLTLTYKKMFGKKYDYDLFTVGLSHNF